MQAVQPDIIFAGIPCLELAEAAAKYAKAHRVPLVADVQDIWPEVYTHLLPECFRPLGRLFFHYEYNRARGIFQSANAITAVSRQYLDWAQQLRGSIEKHDRVFHLGYRMPPLSQLRTAKEDIAEFVKRLHLPSGRIIVTFLGQFAASYDIETVAKAAQLLESRNSAVHFVLAGAGGN